MGWLTQYEDKKSAVRVKVGRHENTGQDVTEFIVVDKKSGDYAHIGRDVQTGGQVFRKDTKGKS